MVAPVSIRSVGRATVVVWSCLSIIYVLSKQIVTETPRGVITTQSEQKLAIKVILTLLDKYYILSRHTTYRIHVVVASRSKKIKLAILLTRIFKR